MADICLVTANFGGIDPIRKVSPCPFIHSYYYTDVINTHNIKIDDNHGWTNIINPNYPRYDFSPRLRAKYFKCQIHRLEETAPYRWLAWGDSSFSIKDLGAIIYWSGKLRTRAPQDRIAFIRHPDRTTVDQEFRLVRDLIAAKNEYVTVRYENEKLQEQVDYYLSLGWDLEKPLYNGGFFIMERNNFTEALLNDWWDQNIRFGVMDQISLSMMLYKNRIDPYIIDANIHDNVCFTWDKHLINR
ncbi:hypothetical protein FV219_10080 [Methylobacterium sp. WL122]|nr:hypothetical protein FV219_10080 [Methylobacterium sp. WL122]